MKVEWKDGFAYNNSGKRIGMLGTSGDGHIRAYLIKTDIRYTESIGDFLTSDQAKDAIDRYFIYVIDN